MVTTHSGMSWCVLANKRVASEAFFGELDRLTWHILREIDG